MLRENDGLPDDSSEDDRGEKSEQPGGVPATPRRFHVRPPRHAVCSPVRQTGVGGSIAPSRCEEHRELQTFLPRGLLHAGDRPAFSGAVKERF